MRTQCHVWHALSLALSALSPLPCNLTTLGLTSPSLSPPLVYAEGEKTLGLTEIDLKKFPRMTDEQSSAKKVTCRSPISPTHTVPLTYLSPCSLPFKAAAAAGNCAADVGVR